MRTPITFFVQGEPKGQPRARACIRGKHAGVYDPGTANAWKHAVADAWRQWRAEPFTGPVHLGLDFIFKRPLSHYRTGKNAGLLRDSAPLAHTGKPDCDNLAKAVMDELTRLGAWEDDRLVCRLAVSRQWAPERGGCVILISEHTA